MIRRTFTNLCLWSIGKINRYKDRNLSQRLFELAEDYNTQPRTFNYYKKPLGCHEPVK